MDLLRRGHHPLLLLTTIAACAAFVDWVAAQDELTTPELGAEPSSAFAEQPLPAIQELPLPADDATETPSATAATVPPENAPRGIGNDEVREMANAQFSDSTVLAVIAANATQFDVSPRALVALKNAGVSETVIEAMLAAETAKKRPTAVESVRQSEAEAARSPLPAEELAKLTEMIERLAAQQEAAQTTQQEAARTTQREPEPAPRADPSPRAWIVGPADRTALAPTIAQVAFTDNGRGRRFESLQSIAGKALAFANPGVSGIAATLGGLFGTDDGKRTAVWALASPSAGRALATGTVFEIEFAHIPGVDPDQYRPAIVRLVPTTDNYRLVAAAKTEGSKAGALPSEPILEELVATKLTRIARGHYRVSADGALNPGEYALVLRPIIQDERRKRRLPEASLGELLGGGTSQILYLTWDFSVTS